MRSCVRRDGAVGAWGYITLRVLYGSLFLVALCGLTCGRGWICRKGVLPRSFCLLDTCICLLSFIISESNAMLLDRERNGCDADNNIMYARELTDKWCTTTNDNLWLLGLGSNTCTRQHKSKNVAARCVQALADYIKQAYTVLANRRF